MKTKFIMVLVLFLALSFKMTGQDSAIGMFSSGRSAGICVEFGYINGSHSMIRTYADLYKVLNGKYNAPGVKSDYHLLFTVAEWKYAGNYSVDLETGPGVLIGYVRDKDQHKGLAAALSGMILVNFKFNRISITAGLSAALGMHVNIETKVKEKMDIYANGLREAWMPEICIKYCF